MGLSISRTIIEAHGGRIWASRNPDAGVTFQFTLPAMRNDEVVSSAAARTG
jgi:signal transduction histidine kinase